MLQQTSFTFSIRKKSADKNRFIRRIVTHRRNAADSADEAGYQLDNVSGTFNEGFAKRKEKLYLKHQQRQIVKFLLTGIPFFEALEDKLLPNTKIEINFEIEKDSNLIGRSGGNDCRVIITRLQLFVPRIIFNSEGQTLYMENYFKPYKWTYSNEVIESSAATRQRVGNNKQQTEFQNRSMFLSL